TKGAWLDYVLRAFRLFFDDVVFTWKDDLKASLANSLAAQPRNLQLWSDEAARVRGIRYEDDLSIASDSSLRRDFYKDVVPEWLGTKDPSRIDHPVLAAMALDAKKTYDRTKGE